MMDASKQLMNMRVMKPSQDRRSAGEIFVFSFRDDDFYWGRIISTRLTFDGHDDVILCYIYHISTTGIAAIPLLDKSQLLIPPLITDDELWRMGYFQTVVASPIKAGDIHPTHCFKVPQDEIYRDEYGRLLPGRMEPCGAHLFHTCAMIDEMLSGVLGFPISPMT